MGNPEKAKGPERAPENIVGAQVDHSRSVIGSYDSVREKTMWNDAAMKKRIDEGLSRHEKVPVIDTYNFNADISRTQAAKIVLQARNEKRELRPEEQREMIAAQLRITSLESLSGALDAYMDIMEQYKAYKAAGLRADPEKEQVALRHLAMVTQVAERRADISMKLHLKQIDRKEGQQLALQADDDMRRIMASEDADIPGANKEGFLPAYSLILSMLSDDYNNTLKQHRDAIDKNFSKIRERSDKANTLLKTRFPGKKPGEILRDEANAVLAEVGDGYDLKQYTDDLLVLQRNQSTFEVLKKRGRDNVVQLARLNDALGRYQIHRATLSSIRHHFDQGYDAASTDKPFPGQTSDKAMDASREFLGRQQQRSVSSLEKHLTAVDKDVLKVGIKEKGEKLWNERGRVLVTRLADKIASLETSWVPDVPLMEKGAARSQAKEYLMSGLYDALGWPRGADGQPKEWKDLTDQEKKEVQDKQQSVQKSIDTFRESGVLQRLQGSVKAARMLIDRKDLQAENYMQIGEIDDNTLPNETVTDANIDALVKQYGAPVVYKLCFNQLQRDWGNYSENYQTLLTEFHDSIGAHYDFSRMMKDFADKQKGIAELLAGFGIIGWLLAAVGAVAAYKGGRWIITKGGGLTLRAARGTASAALKGGKEAVRTTANVTREGLKALKNLKGASETFETFEDVSNALKLAREAKDNKRILELLKNPLVKESAKGGSAEAKGMLKALRFLTVGKWAAKGLPIAGVILDVVFYKLNENEIAHAKETKNLGMQQTLEFRRKELIAQGGIGIALLGVSGGTAGIGIPAAIVASVYTSILHDRTVEWDKGTADYLSQSPEELKQRLAELPFNNIDFGQRTAYGDSVLSRTWKNVFWKQEEIDAEENKKMESVEKINRQMRQEILAAYFLKTMKVRPQQNGESDAQFQKRVQDGVRDRLNYMKHMTTGNYTVPDVKVMYDSADKYADLEALRRMVPDKKALSYEWNGEAKTLDLQPLSYIASDDKKQEKPYFKMMTQYTQEVMALPEAISDFQNMPEIGN